MQCWARAECGGVLPGAPVVRAALLLVEEAAGREFRGEAGRRERRNSGSYTYDGNGQRVVKSSGGATTVSIFLGDQVLAEYDNGVLPSAPTNEYIYAGGQRVMSVQSGVTDYWHYDHLSPRLRTDASGNVADQRGTFPFGESWYSPGQSPYMFTTYYRDYESGNDYAQARHYISRLARFSSPDPVPGSASDPQSLNAYSYVESDPANLADPLGLCPSPGICITVSAPYWPSGPSLPSTSAVFFGGAGPDDINAEGQIFARTGRSAPIRPPLRPSIQCSNTIGHRVVQGAQGV